MRVKMQIFVDDATYAALGEVAEAMGKTHARVAGDFLEEGRGAFLLLAKAVAGRGDPIFSCGKHYKAARECRCLDQGRSELR